jgi:hypothetical protein
MVLCPLFGRALLKWTWLRGQRLLQLGDFLNSQNDEVAELDSRTRPAAMAKVSLRIRFSTRGCPSSREKKAESARSLTEALHIEVASTITV